MVECLENLHLPIIPNPIKNWEFDDITDVIEKIKKGESFCNEIGEKI